MKFTDQDGNVFQVDAANLSANTTPLKEAQVRALLLKSRRINTDYKGTSRVFVVDENGKKHHCFFTAIDVKAV